MAKDTTAPNPQSTTLPKARGVYVQTEKLPDRYLVLHEQIASGDSGTGHSFRVHQDVGGGNLYLVVDDKWVERLPIKELLTSWLDSYFGTATPAEPR